MNDKKRNIFAALFLIFSTIILLPFAMTYTPPVKAQPQKIFIEEATNINDMNEDVLKDILVHFLIDGNWEILGSVTREEPYEFRFIYKPHKDIKDITNYISNKIDEDFIVVFLDRENREIIKAMYDKEGKIF